MLLDEACLVRQHRLFECASASCTAFPRCGVRWANLGMCAMATGAWGVCTCVRWPRMATGAWCVCTCVRVLQTCSTCAVRLLCVLCAHPLPPTLPAVFHLLAKRTPATTVLCFGMLAHGQKMEEDSLNADFYHEPELFSANYYNFQQPTSDFTTGNAPLPVQCNGGEANLKRHPYHAIH